MRNKVWFLYIAYLLLCGLNCAMMAYHGVLPNNWQWWVWAFIPIISHVIGKEIENC